jgi:hypothetical protein
MHLKRIFILTPLYLLLWLFIYHGANAAITLVSFTATVQDNSILIEWETATEIDNYGYFVTRATDPAAAFDRVSDFIVATGSGVIGDEYQYVDQNVTEDTIYYYILESVDLNQQIEYFGPISVTFATQGSPTPTITPTKTPITKTPTRTPTRTPKTKTPTPTRSRTPENTSTPTTPTITPTYFTETPTLTFTPSITPSPTLLDAPGIVLDLPVTNTPIATAEPTIPLPSIEPTPNGFVARIIESGFLAMLSLICLVILVWAIISVGIYIFIQKRVSTS